MIGTREQKHRRQ